MFASQLSLSTTPSAQCVILDENNRPCLFLSKDLWLRFDFEEFTDNKSLRKARQELREKPGIVANSLKVLRLFLEKEPNLKIPIHDDAFLTRFLRRRKYYAGSAFKLMKNYYKMKASKDLYLNNILLSSLKLVFMTGLVQIFPERDQYGRRIIYLDIGAKLDFTIVSMTELLQATHALVTLCLLEPRTQLNGVVYIINCEGQSLAQLSQFTPKIIKNIFDYLQKCSPMSTKSIIIINNMKILSILSNIVKSFLIPKWTKKVHFLGGNLKELHQMVDPECLPTSLGGTCDYEYDGAVVFKFIRHYQPEFDVINTYGYDENLSWR